jgi:hypothetical protein
MTAMGKWSSSSLLTHFKASMFMVMSVRRERVWVSSSPSGTESLRYLVVVRSIR